MPSPATSSSTSVIRLSSSSYVNALLDEDKWGSAIGTGVTLTYSFPWALSKSATFLGDRGLGTYSDLEEQNAAYHYGLDIFQQAAARQALASWANVANVQFRETFESSTNVGDIRFAWTSASEPGEDSSRVWGWAYLPAANSPCAGDVWINTQSSGASDSDWSAGSFNYSSLIHEIGHTLGLKHPFEGSPVLPVKEDSTQYTVMSYTDAPHSLFVKVNHRFDGDTYDSFHVQPDTPMLYDIAAIQYLYGANMSYRTGDDVYTFDPDTPFMRTIWDAGGSDTISVSNFTKACVIDLRQGAFSKITIESGLTSGTNWEIPPPKATYDGTDDLAIAYGCVIESAIGGAGADTLIGNAANNTLRGNEGNDFLDGQAGIDTAIYAENRSQYGVSQSAQTIKVNNATEGLDTLVNMERLKFADTMLAFDLGVEGDAGQAMAFIGTIAPGFLNTPSVRGNIIARFDQGQTMKSLSQLALDLNLVPKSSNIDLANTIYHNVMGGTPSQDMSNALLAYIREHGQADFLAAVAGLHLNVDLVGLQTTGVEYVI